MTENKDDLKTHGAFHRINTNEIKIFPKTRVGMNHSYTCRESKSMSKLLLFEIKCSCNNISLVDKNSSDWYYCIAEDGTIFKFSKDYCNFYYLDLDNYVWRKKQSLFGLIFDSFLKYQELDAFKDYFNECNE